MSDLKANLFALAARRTSPVLIEGVQFMVRELGADVFHEYVMVSRTDKKGADAMLLAAAVVDADGNPLLTLEEAKQLVGQSARVVLPLIGAALEASGLRDEKKG